MIHTDEGAVQLTYDAVADAYADYFRSTDPAQAIDVAMIEHFVSLLGSNQRVLDAGCGAGRMMPVLAHLGCEVEGVDLSPGMIRRAQGDHSDFHTQVASLTALPHEEGSFDGFFSWYSTIHSADRDLPVIFSQAHRVLRSLGLLLVAFQTGDGVREVGQGYRDRGHDVQLMRYHRTASRVGQVLQRAGFTLTASLDREAVGDEDDGQAVLIARRRT